MLPSFRKLSIFQQMNSPNRSSDLIWSIDIQYHDIFSLQTKPKRNGVVRTSNTQARTLDTYGKSILTMARTSPTLDFLSLYVLGASGNENASYCVSFYFFFILLQFSYYFIFKKINNKWLVNTYWDFISKNVDHLYIWIYFSFPCR